MENLVAPNSLKLAKKFRNATPGEFGKMLEKYNEFVVHFPVHISYIDVFNKTRHGHDRPELRKFQKDIVGVFKRKINFQNTVAVVENEENTKAIFSRYGLSFSPRMTIISPDAKFEQDITGEQRNTLLDILRNPKTKVIVFTGLFRSSCLEFCKSSVEPMLAEVGRNDVKLVFNSALSKDPEDVNSLYPSSREKSLDGQRR